MRHKFVISICSNTPTIELIKSIGWKTAQVHSDALPFIVTTEFFDLLERRAYEKGLRDAGYQGLITKYRSNGAGTENKEK